MRHINFRPINLKIIPNKNYSIKTQTLNKILATIIVLFVFRLLSLVPLPFFKNNISDFISKNFLFVSMFAGESFRRMGFMATGVSAYITSSIIIDMLASAFEKLHKIKHSPGGQIRLKKIKRYLAYGFSILLSIVQLLYFDLSRDMLVDMPRYIIYPTIVLLQLIGTYITVKMADKLDNQGITQGLSCLILFNIVSRIPQLVLQNHSKIMEFTGDWRLYVFIAVMLMIFIGIIIAEKSEYRVRLNYAKSNIYTTMFDLKKFSYMPLRLNLGGVMPIILAGSLTAVLSFGLTVAKQHNKDVALWFENHQILSQFYIVSFTSLCIFIFAFLYVTLVVDPIEIREKLTQSSMSIVDVSPGPATITYLKKLINKLTWLSSTYLFLISFISSAILIVPSVINGAGLVGIGVTSLIIVVSVSTQIVTSIGFIGKD